MQPMDPPPNQVLGPAPPPLEGGLPMPQPADALPPTRAVDPGPQGPMPPPPLEATSAVVPVAPLGA